MKNLEKLCDLQAKSIENTLICSKEKRAHNLKRTICVLSKYTVLSYVKATKL